MNILVTGETSYVGTMLKKRIESIRKDLKVDFLSLKQNDWEDIDFSVYDTVYHVAALVHKKEKEFSENDYYRVNTELTWKLAIKAKQDGVKQFIFLSTMAVYGHEGKIDRAIVIDKKTVPMPISLYGKTKLMAENKIRNVNSKNFKVAILRVPMIFGPNCPGNYKALREIAIRSPFFPSVKNVRSMIYIDDLSDTLIHVIDKQLAGIYLVKSPQDLCVTEIINTISKFHEKFMCNSILAGWIIKKVGSNFKTTNKVFGSLIYKDEDCLDIRELVDSTDSYRNVWKTESEYTSIN
ncbi:NAD-dependent epimerase/dehydratase family protein [Planococcus rifietoensis]|uniref:NAD-dependent epimerase/dehydratase family protein n=1 Tax=Planococcus rifietoensis TaxID=200991 RepID=UPI00384C28CA